MAKITIIQGPESGRQFQLQQGCTVIGRGPESAIQLPSHTVSRRHAQILGQDDAYILEDLGGLNGTFLKGQRLRDAKLLADGDELTICEFRLVFSAEAAPEEQSGTIQEEIVVAAGNKTLYTEKPEQKLQTVLLLAQQLGQALDLETLLDKLLQNLMQLFPLADSGLVVLCEGSRLVVRAQRVRNRGDADFTYSRTVIRKALELGCGVLSEDLHADKQFSSSSTLDALETKSLMCVPLIGRDGRPLGAIQLDCLRPGKAFDGEHLRLMATVSLMAAVVLENVALNAVRVREENLRRDLALGRDIQLGFLPACSDLPAESGFEIFASILPAKEVSGDLYDFFRLDDGRLAFMVGDVSDKGIPAALFMVKVQTLLRHLAAVTGGPAESLRRLNDALNLNNPSSMFVTVVHGVYDPADGRIVLASGGHPRPLLRQADGKLDEVAMPVGRLLGRFDGEPGVADLTLTLNRGQTLILFSDGYTEAAAPTTGKMFHLEGLKELLSGPRTHLSLAACAEYARQQIESYIGGAEMQDDLTLLMLRRV
jgi:sigma-B regulation protein RsbU (phosphoserine phosphatase)